MDISTPGQISGGILCYFWTILNEMESSGSQEDKSPTVKIKFKKGFLGVAT